MEKTQSGLKERMNDFQFVVLPQETQKEPTPPVNQKKPNPKATGKTQPGRLMINGPL